MHSKPLLSKLALLKPRKAVDAPLPVRVADLDGCELVSHCDSCGRHHRLYPGPADFHPNTRLASLLTRVSCGSRRNGLACGGHPRRLLLVRDARQWALDASGKWAEDESVYWELSDFEALAEPSHRQAVAA